MDEFRRLFFRYKRNGFIQLIPMILLGIFTLSIIILATVKDAQDIRGRAKGDLYASITTTPVPPTTTPSPCPMDTNYTAEARDCGGTMVCTSGGWVCTPSTISPITVGTYCDSARCSYGCTSLSSTGGVCKAAPTTAPSIVTTRIPTVITQTVTRTPTRIPTTTPSPCPMDTNYTAEARDCGGTMVCTSGGWVCTPSTISPITVGTYCDSARCSYGCTSLSSTGGVCKAAPTTAPSTVTPVPRDERDDLSTSKPTTTGPFSGYSGGNLGGGVVPTPKPVATNIAPLSSQFKNEWNNAFGDGSLFDGAQLSLGSEQTSIVPPPSILLSQNPQDLRDFYKGAAYAGAGGAALAGGVLLAGSAPAIVPYVLSNPIVQNTLPYLAAADVADTAIASVQCALSGNQNSPACVTAAVSLIAPPGAGFADDVADLVRARGGIKATTRSDSAWDDAQWTLNHYINLYQAYPPKPKPDPFPVNFQPQTIYYYQKTALNEYAAGRNPPVAQMVFDAAAQTKTNILMLSPSEYAYMQRNMLAGRSSTELINNIQLWKRTGSGNIGNIRPLGVNEPQANTAFFSPTINTIVLPRSDVDSGLNESKFFSNMLHESGHASDNYYGGFKKDANWLTEIRQWYLSGLWSNTISPGSYDAAVDRRFLQLIGYPLP